MKNLLSKDTASDDANIYEAKIHWVSYIVPVLFVIIGLLGIILLFNQEIYLKIVGVLLLIALFTGIKSLLSIKFTKIQLSEFYLSISQGILTRNIVDIPIKKLEGIVLYQSLMGKILNYGTLKVTTGDVSFSYPIENPMELRRRILNKQNHE